MWDPSREWTKLGGKAVIAVKNNPVQWTTPLGLPVVQPYRKLGRHLIKTSLQVLTLQRETDKVMVKRQRTAFPPNFVHSLDGSYMMMTTIACKEEAYESAMVAKFGDDTSCHPLLDNETWCDVSGGVKKGRIYGFGSVSDPASFLEGTSSTITSQEVVYERVRNEMRGEMDAKAAEMEAKH
ncbi:unnamed protein product [Lactuca virosa]|uniref:DNA-directed RNA polymerase n=1 Tax=Lactuca virosa TaxID=75947 RepID=A0AAU9NGG7_9ASTR|nr:unnamed protein product [Lactuca virosa]